jgi:hypothetical protein
MRKRKGRKADRSFDTNILASFSKCNSGLTVSYSGFRGFVLLGRVQDWKRREFRWTKGGREEERKRRANCLLLSHNI